MNKKISIKQDLTVSNQDIDDIICAALEGGINYWCYKAEVGEKEYLGKYASDQISRGGSLKLYVEEPFEDKEMYVLTKKNVLIGLERFYKEYASHYPDVFQAKGEEILIETYAVDAEAADMIVQLGLFGDVIYG